MSSSCQIPFTIDRLDSQAQGVARVNGKVTFIPKTLPGECGHARITLEKKNWQSAQLIEVTTKSADRISPECGHYQNCGGCHFLHTTYEKEIFFKELGLKNDLKRTGVTYQEMQVIPSLQRFGNRRKMQFHYSISKNIWGLKRARSQEIIPTPNCLLPSEKLRPLLQYLNEDQKNLSVLVKQHQAPDHGVFEISIPPDESQAQIAFFSDTREPNFFQVNEYINDQMVQLCTSFFLSVSQEASGVLVDLFGGHGNLSKHLNQFSTLVVDSHVEQTKLSSHQTALVGSLYNKEFVQKKLLPHLKGLGRVKGLIIDPPRSGWREMGEVISLIRPEKLLVVSCDSQTLLRDLSTASFLKHPSRISILDMFAGSYHFETVLEYPHLTWN